MGDLGPAENTQALIATWTIACRQISLDSSCFFLNSLSSLGNTGQYGMVFWVVTKAVFNQKQANQNTHWGQRKPG